MTLRKIRQKLHEQKNKIGLVGGSIEIQEYDEAEHFVSANISPEGWNIKVSVRKGFDPISDRRQKAYARKKKIINGLETMLSHVGVKHECAHWELPYGSGKGCPFDIYNHDKILEAVKKTLSEDKKVHAGYVVNAFEDMIINPRCREFDGDVSGQVLFWDWEGHRAKQKGHEGYTPFYEAFVKLNLHLFGENIDRALVKRHYTNASEVDECVSKTINDLNLEENIQDTLVLFRKDRWSGMAETFAKNLSHLLETAPTERLSAYSQDGNGSEGEGNEQSGNGIEQKMGTRDGTEEITFGRYASNDKLSPNFNSYEQLDSLYRRLARDIAVNVEAMTKDQSLEISPLTYRAFDEEIDDIARIKPTKLFIEDGEIQFACPDKPLTIHARSKIQKRAFPDFKMLVIDNSGSMKSAPDGSDNTGKTNTIPWGDNSKYHYALLGHYGIENFLQHQGIAQYIQHGLSLFSSQTRYKEAGFFELDKVRKHALNPDWGSTNLDAQALTSALRGRESFVLTLSDGEIGNWDAEKTEFEDLARKNHYAHIQIGGKTGFTEDLESFGMPVFYITGGKDLSRLMVDTAKATYRRFTRE
jgi:hypothetical protein